MDLIYIETDGPYPGLLVGSRYVITFVDSASRLQRPYGGREKTEPAILAVVKLFVADMVVPRVFRTNNGTECSNSIFVDYCINVGIWREFTTTHSPQQNDP